MRSVKTIFHLKMPKTASNLDSTNNFFTTFSGPLTSHQLRSTVDWNDRIGLQSLWSAKEKGWVVDVEWKPTLYGTGVFAKHDIDASSVLRHGRCGSNLLRFQNVEEMEGFCKDTDGMLKPELVKYVSDYLYGFKPNRKSGAITTDFDSWYGIWVPGNGLNHSEQPNTIYQVSSDGLDVGIDLCALTNVKKGDELHDDYRRHGNAPPWAKDFASKLGVSLNFTGCNDFV